MIKLAVKKYLWLLLAIASSVFMIIIIAWLFSLHGTAGLVQVNGAFRSTLIALGTYCVIFVTLWAFLFSRKRFRNTTPDEFNARWHVRVITVIGIIIPLGIVGYLGYYNLYQAEDKAPQLLLTEQTGTYGTPDVAVTFWTREPSLNMVMYGTGEKSLSLKEEIPVQKHVFVLRDLEPGAQVWYQVNEGKRCYFQTEPGEGKPLHFAVASDSHYGRQESRNDLSRQMLQYIADSANRFDFFFFLGDFVEHGYNDAMWMEGLAAFSPFTSVIPTSFTASNHDTLLGGLKRYHEYISLPAAGDYRLWKRIDVHDIHFLLLDLEWSGEAFTPEQKIWLEQQLADIPRGDWKIVMSHAFYYSSGINTNGWNWYDNPDTIKELVPLFEKYGVDLVFSGHNHYLEWLQKNNINYIITAAFGAVPNRQQTYISPASMWYQFGQYAFVDVIVNPGAATITFRDSANTVLKTFTVDKR